jgi:hypothetical protein
MYNKYYVPCTHKYTDQLSLWYKKYYDKFGAVYDITLNKYY